MTVIGAFANLAFASPTDVQSLITVPSDSPLIYKTGRWDNNQTSWWGGHGIKLHFSSALTTLYLDLGEATTPAPAEVSISVDYGVWFQQNFTVGLNQVNLTGLSKKKRDTHVIRLATESYEGWVNVWTSVRLQLYGISFNKEAILLPYTPSKVEFEFIGDSISAGCYSPQGQVTGWAFMTSEYFKVEHNQLAQPGACLTSLHAGCYGNDQGMGTLYFQTQNSDYEWIPALNNKSTPWNFARYSPPGPTHVFIMIGTNDFSNNVTAPEFKINLINFTAHVREIYPTQPMFIFSDIYQSFHDQQKDVVSIRGQEGDKNIYFIDTTGWIDGNNATEAIPNNGHPTPYGQVKMSGLLNEYLTTWGLKVPVTWSTPL